MVGEWRTTIKAIAFFDGRNRIRGGGQLCLMCWLCGDDDNNNFVWFSFVDRVRSEMGQLFELTCPPSAEMGAWRIAGEGRWGSGRYRRSEGKH